MGGVSSDFNSARLSKATCILIDGCDTIRLTRLTGSLKNIVGTYLEHKDPGRYIPILFLLYYWGSLSGFPVKSIDGRFSKWSLWNPTWRKGDLVGSGV